jgi:hypothetical protein
MRLYVIAYDYTVFKRWCWERQINVQHPIYVTAPEKLRGVTLTRDQLVLVPGWGHRADALAMDAEVARITGSSMVEAQ